MKVSGILWAGLVALSLAGCATRGPAVDSPVLRDPEALAAAQASQATRAAWLASQADWSFSGRVAVSANGKGGSGRIDWEQADARYEVALSAPVTRQSWRLAGDLQTGAGRLEGLEGGTREGSNAAALLRQATGWDIPVASMVHWARGLADPTAGVEGLEYDTQGRLRALSQHGWRVDYLDWFPAEGARPVLPRRVEARRDGAAVKLAVDQWQMAPQ